MPRTPQAAMAMKPPADVKPPAPPTPPSSPHPHTAAIVSGALLIGLILGAAAGYYGGEFKRMMDSTTLQTQETQQETAQEQDTDATASTYGEVETNPLQDVQTNPFE
ncbi:MAG: hypothetical protein V4436_01085 [Patescibacteria group bacterium]